jgi:hypothetical protein
MSLGVVVKGSEGIVLAADSRVTLTATAQDPNTPNVQMQIPVNFDNATKLLTFAEPNQWIGAVTYGDAVIGTSPNDIRTAQSFIPEFEVGLPEGRLPVQEFAQRMSDFYLAQWQNKMPAGHQSAGMVFVVAGFDEGSAYGSVYLFNIPNTPAPEQRSANDFGITAGGQHEHVIRLVQGHDPAVIEIARQALGLNAQQVDTLKNALRPLNLGIPYGVLPLQDCIDLAVFFIKTTVAIQNLSIGLRGVGGGIDVAVITQREGLKVIQRKALHG